MKDKKIGLALGGGGARGLAHIGVLKALQEYNIPISYIAGTSMGAVVGAWYALNKEVDELEKIALKTKRGVIFPVADILKRKNKDSLFTGSSADKILQKHFGTKNLKDCEIPFRAIATDTSNGDSIDIKTGRIRDALRASTSLPIVFQPAKIKSKSYTDGGLSNPVPADVVRDMGAEVILAVDVSSKWIDISHSHSRVKGIYSAIMETMALVEYQLAKRALERADLVLRPPVLTFNWFEFDRAKEIIDAGYKETKKNIDQIAKLSGYEVPQKTPLEKLWDLVSPE